MRRFAPLLLLALAVAASASAQVILPAAGGLEAPALPGLPSAPEAADSGSIDLWPDLERRLLTSIAEPLEARTDEWKQEAARRLQSDPTLPLAETLGKAFAATHRLSNKKAGVIAEILAEKSKDGLWEGPAQNRLFAVDGKLYASDGTALKRYAGDGWDELLGLPAMQVQDLRLLDGRLHAAGSGGVFAARPGSSDWELLRSEATHSIERMADVLYAGGEAGLFVRRGDAWVPDDSLRGVPVRHLAQLGGRYFASTDRGLFEGRPAASDQHWQPSGLARLFGAKPSIARAKGELRWNPKPIFDKYPVRQVTEVEGRLALATSKGIFIQNPDGSWRHELEEKGEVSRLVPLPDGQTFAMASDDVMRRGARSWDVVLKDWRRDIAAVDNVLFVAASKGLHILLGFPHGWEVSAARTLEPFLKSAESSGSADPGLVASDQSIRDRSGRTIFDTKKDP